MINHINKPISRRKVAYGSGVLNSIINSLPFELHLPGYQYCGPGTKLNKRLARGDSGINELDKACKEHDKSYSKHKSIENRHKADKILAEKAWQRVKSVDASLGERANSLLVSTAMKLKSKLGAGMKRKHRGARLRKKKAKKVSFQNIVRNVKNSLVEKNPTNLQESIGVALKAAKQTVGGKKKSIKTPRIIPTPKIGGIIPFLPIFAGLSALGALSGGAAGIAKAVNEANDAKNQLNENKRHNKHMEAIALGRGVYLKPYKTGLGLYLSPAPKNF